MPVLRMEGDRRHRHCAPPSLHYGAKPRTAPIYVGHSRSVPEDVAFGAIADIDTTRIHRECLAFPSIRADLVGCEPQSLARKDSSAVRSPTNAAQACLV